MIDNNDNAQRDDEILQRETLHRYMIDVIDEYYIDHDSRDDVILHIDERTRRIIIYDA